MQLNTPCRQRRAGDAGAGKFSIMVCDLGFGNFRSMSSFASTVLTAGFFRLRSIPPAFHPVRLHLPQRFDRSGWSKIGFGVPSFSLNFGRNGRPHQSQNGTEIFFYCHEPQYTPLATIGPPRTAGLIADWRRTFLYAAGAGVGVVAAGGAGTAPARAALLDLIVASLASRSAAIEPTVASSPASEMRV